MVKGSPTLGDLLEELQHLKGEMMTDDSPGIIKRVAVEFTEPGVEEQLESTDLDVITNTLARMMWAIKGIKGYNASHQRAIGRLHRWANEEKGLQVPDILAS